MNMLVPQLVAGLSNGSILLLAALGLSLTFGQMGVINNAHGEFMMAGAYTAYVMSTVFASKTLALGLALVAGFVVAGLLGLLLDMLLLSRMRAPVLWTRCWSHSAFRWCCSRWRETSSAPRASMPKRRKR